MRLIDADALKKNVRNKCWMPDWCYVLIDAAIADMPTIEERKKEEEECSKRNTMTECKSKASSPKN